MLYDPKWEKPEVKADPFSLESLIAWLEQQDPSTLYDYTEPSSCLVAQHLKSHGAADYILDSWSLPAGWKFVTQGHGRARSEWSFGAALERARKVLADQRKFETTSAVGS